MLPDTCIPLARATADYTLPLRGRQRATPLPTTSKVAACGLTTSGDRGADGPQYTGELAGASHSDPARRSTVGPAEGPHPVPVNGALAAHNTLPGVGASLRPLPALGPELAGVDPEDLRLRARPMDLMYFAVCVMIEPGKPRAALLSSGARRRVCPPAAEARPSQVAQ